MEISHVLRKANFKINFKFLLQICSCLSNNRMRVKRESVDPIQCVKSETPVFFYKFKIESQTSNNSIWQRVQK